MAKKRLRFKHTIGKRTICKRAICLLRECVLLKKHKRERNRHAIPLCEAIACF